MKHIDEDRLLEYALNTIDDADERGEIESHLEECGECRSRLEIIGEDLDFIGSLKPDLNNAIPKTTTRKRKYLYGMIRAAALIVFGFVIGLAVSGGSERADVYVTPCYVRLSPPADSLGGFAESDATGSSMRYYERLKESAD